MYKIITHTGETHLTEKPNFIRKHENGCFVLTDKDHAEGGAVVTSRGTLPPIRGRTVDLLDITVSSLIVCVLVSLTRL